MKPCHIILHLTTAFINDTQTINNALHHIRHMLQKEEYLKF